MLRCVEGFAYQRADGSIVAVSGGVVVNDDDPVLADHADKFAPFEVPYIEPKPKAPVQAPEKPVAPRAPAGRATRRR